MGSVNEADSSLAEFVWQYLHDPLGFVQTCDPWGKKGRRRERASRRRAGNRPMARWSRPATSTRAGAALTTRRAPGGASPAQALCSNSSSTRSMSWSLGWSSGAQAITPDVYLWSNASVSATAATSSGSPRSAATSSRTSPWAVPLARQVSRAAA